MKKYRRDGKTRGEMEKERGDGKDGKLARALRARILLKIVFNFNAIFSMFRVPARIFIFHHFPLKSGGRMEKMEN